MQVGPNIYMRIKKNISCWASTLGYFFFVGTAEHTANQEHIKKNQLRTKKTTKTQEKIRKHTEKPKNTWDILFYFFMVFPFLC